jgi:hypothetical protein
MEGFSWDFQFWVLHLFVVAVLGVPYPENFDFGCGSESENENSHKSLGS